MEFKECSTTKAHLPHYANNNFFKKSSLNKKNNTNRTTECEEAKDKKLQRSISYSLVKVHTHKKIKTSLVILHSIIDITYIQWLYLSHANYKLQLNAGNFFFFCSFF